MPSPSQSHSYRAIVPSVSLEAEASKVTVWPTVGAAGEAVKAAVGDWLEGAWEPAIR